MPREADDRSLLEIARASIPKLPDYPTTEQSTATLLDMLEDTIELLAAMTIQGSEGIGPFDTLYLAALSRSKSTILGFLAMIEQRNLLCAEPMIRFQLDSAMRVYACLIAKEPLDLIQHILKGGNPKKFKDIGGEPLNDYWLHTRLSYEYPEVSRVYSDTSGYVHLSVRHISGVWDAQGSKPDRLVLTRPDALPYWDELQVRASMTVFVWATSCLLDLCYRWHGRHQNSSETMETLERQEQRE